MVFKRVFLRPNRLSQASWCASIEGNLTLFDMKEKDEGHALKM